MKSTKLIGFHVAAVMVAMGAHVAQADILQPSLGNFPDAVIINAEFNTFTNLNINGDVINDTGFLFEVSNTSWGDGLHSSFVNDPDGDFAVSDVLTAAAAAALDAAQPFGLYTFGAELPLGAGAFTSAPSEFLVNIQEDGGALEINFSIDLGSSPDGLLFDPDAMGINAIFTNTRTGTLSFFISTLSTNLLDNLLAEDNGFPAIDVATEMAWYAGSMVVTEFNAPGETFDGEELRPRGELVAIPAPGAMFLAMIDLPAVAWVKRRLT